MTRIIEVDERLAEYRPFFQDDFAHRAFQAADAAPAIRQPVFDLVADWRSASYAGALPALIPTAVKTFHESYASVEPTAPGILRYSEVILALLAAKVPEIAHDGALQRKLRESLVSISMEVTETQQKHPSRVDSEALWRRLLPETAFIMGLHGTMTLSYILLYSAYENFIVSVAALAPGGCPLRVSDRDFSKKLRNIFGKTVDSFWFAQEIQVAKLIRHALLHAGGRTTPKLREQQVLPVVVHDNHLHIFPEHTRSLYDVLKEAAMSVIRDFVLWQEQAME